MVSQRLLQMTPCTDLVARVRSPCCQIMDLLRKWQRSTVSISPGVIETQAPQSAQLILQVAKTLRNIERLRERLAHFGAVGCRCAQRGPQSHLLARVRSPSASKSAKRLLGATAALLEQR